jgi:phosphatidate phosphatase APP1
MTTSAIKLSQGPTERYLRRSGAEHKRTAIRRLLEAYPKLPFALIGDRGRGEADHHPAGRR